MKVKLIKGNLVKSTIGSVGYDVFSLDDLVIPRKESRIINTGVSLEIPLGFEVQARGRSGLNINHNIICPTGTIDPDYKGEIKIKLYNLGNQLFKIKKGDRIAQLVVSKVEDIEGAEIFKKNRVGGFGSTGR